MAALANRFGKHKWWIFTVALTVPVAAIAAGVPNVFTAGTVISAAQVNANFQNLSDRVTALEAAKMTVSTPITFNGTLAATGKAGTFTTAGGPLLLIVSGSAWISSANGGVPGLIDVAVQLDGPVVGHLRGYTNELNSHKAFATLTLPINSPAPAAGTHNVTILYGNTATTSDQNDYFTVTVVEYH